MRSKYSEANPEPFWGVGKKPTVERAAKRYTRTVNGVRIIFWARDTIYVMGEGQRFIINRWYDTRRNYQEWRKMCQTLKRNDGLTIQSIRELANRHDFYMCGFTSLPKGIEEIASLNELPIWNNKEKK